MMNNHAIPEYGWKNNDATCAHIYLLSAIEKALDDWRSAHALSQKNRLRLFDAGCGNGYLAHALSKRGYEVAGCDYSKEGIAQARKSLPNSRFEVLSVYENMADVFGYDSWDIVLTSEVIEHLYDPGKLIRNIFPLLRSEGLLVITTPYHGYLKNLVLALSNNMDQHFTVLWDGGHIKFWSCKTLSNLVEKNGFIVEKFYGAGRLPWLWKSMVITAIKGNLYISK